MLLYICHFVSETIIYVFFYNFFSLESLSVQKVINDPIFVDTTTKLASLYSIGMIFL